MRDEIRCEMPKVKAKSSNKKKTKKDKEMEKTPFHGQSWLQAQDTDVERYRAIHFSCLKSQPSEKILPDIYLNKSDRSKILLLYKCWGKC